MQRVLATDGSESGIGDLRDCLYNISDRVVGDLGVNDSVVHTCVDIDGNIVLGQDELPVEIGYTKRINYLFTSFAD